MSARKNHTHQTKGDAEAARVDDKPVAAADTPVLAAPGAADIPVRAPAAPPLEAEAKAFCESLEKFYRRLLGDMPSTADVAELHAQQATLHDLLDRAARTAGESHGKLAETAAERDRLKDALARLGADFLSYQARAAKDLERAEEQALRGYMLDLLPILDSLDLAQADARSPNRDPARVLHALDILAQGFGQALKVRGLERFPAAGRPFDPNFHEAVATRPADAAKGETPNQVVEELRPGYLWKGLVLRPVQVMITVAPPAPAP